MRWTPFTIVVVLGSCLGCARLETVDECETVIEMVNEQLGEISDLARASRHFELAENGYQPSDETPPSEGGDDDPSADDEAAGEESSSKDEGSTEQADPEALAARYDKLASNLRALDLKSVGLKRVVQSYSSMLLSAGRSLEKLTPRQLERPSKVTQAAFDKVIKQERSIVQQLDRVCHPH